MFQDNSLQEKIQQISSLLRNPHQRQLYNPSWKNQKKLYEKSLSPIKSKSPIKKFKLTPELHQICQKRHSVQETQKKFRQILGLFDRPDYAVQYNVIFNQNTFSNQLHKCANLQEKVSTFREMMNTLFTRSKQELNVTNIVTSRINRTLLRNSRNYGRQHSPISPKLETFNDMIQNYQNLLIEDEQFFIRQEERQEEQGNSTEETVTPIRKLTYSDNKEAQFQNFKSFQCAINSVQQFCSILENEKNDSQQSNFQMVKSEKIDQNKKEEEVFFEECQSDSYQSDKQSQVEEMVEKQVEQLEQDQKNFLKESQKSEESKNVDEVLSDEKSQKEKSIQSEYKSNSKQSQSSCDDSPQFPSNKESQIASNLGLIESKYFEVKQVSKVRQSKIDAGMTTIVRRFNVIKKIMMMKCYFSIRDFAIQKMKQQNQDEGFKKLNQLMENQMKICFVRIQMSKMRQKNDFMDLDQGAQYLESEQDQFEMNMEEMDDNKGMKKYVNKLSDRKLQRTDQKENEKISFDKYQQRVHKRQDSNQGLQESNNGNNNHIQSQKHKLGNKFKKMNDVVLGRQKMNGFINFEQYAKLHGKQY